MTLLTTSFRCLDRCLCAPQRWRPSIEIAAGKIENLGRRISDPGVNALITQIRTKVRMDSGQRYGSAETLCANEVICQSRQPVASSLSEVNHVPGSDLPHTIASPRSIAPLSVTQTIESL